MIGQRMAELLRPLALPAWLAGLALGFFAALALPVLIPVWMLAVWAFCAEYSGEQPRSFN